MAQSPGEQLLAPGFEQLASGARDALRAAGGGALCLYVDGQPTLDIWDGHADPMAKTSWQSDTMAMSWSTSKGVASTVLHMLVDRGLLAYDDRIADHWPEFGTNGKDNVTIRQLMAMEAGLYDIRHLIDSPEQMLDHDVMAALLAAARPGHVPGQRNAYHAMTYGWMVGELVRRLAGMSLGSFVRVEMAEPLGLDGCHIGLPPEHLDRVAAFPDMPPENSWVRRIAKAIDPLTRVAGLSPERIAASFAPKGGHRVIPTAAFLQTEAPSVNGVFTARSLARLYAALGSDEPLDGVSLWSSSTRRSATQRQNHRRDLVVPIRVGWRLGYHQPFPHKKTSPDSFGFYGAFGSGAFADPTRGLAVGLVVQQAKGLLLNTLVPEILYAVDAAARSRRTA